MIKKREAFTILELLVVIAIIAILAIIAIPNFIGRINEAKETRGTAEINSVSKAVNMYFMDNNGLYPCEGEVTKSDLPSSIDLNKLVPKYLDKKPSTEDFYIDDNGVIKVGVVRKPNPAFDFVFDPETGTILNYIGTSTEVVIPKQIDGTDVIMLGENFFIGKNITYLQTSDPLQTIDSQAFLDCTSLSTVEF